MSLMIYFITLIYFIFLRFYLFFFYRGGREGEREGNKHQCVVASLTSPTGEPHPHPRLMP